MRELGMKARIAALEKAQADGVEPWLKAVTRICTLEARLKAATKRCYCHEVIHPDIERPCPACRSDGALLGINPEPTKCSSPYHCPCGCGAHIGCFIDDGDASPDDWQPDLAVVKVLAGYLVHAPEQGDWDWDEHCEGLAGGLVSTLHLAGYEVALLDGTPDQDAP